MKLSFSRLEGVFSVLRCDPQAVVPTWATGEEFASITRTTDELSVVCPSKNVPGDIDPGISWVCFKLHGPIPFSQTGVLLAFIRPLSENGVPIFTVSTYDTD